MFVNQSFVSNKFRTLFLKMFNYIENNGNIHFNSNGEGKFIDAFFEQNRIHKGELTIFDVGANVGNYTQMLTEKCQKYSISANIHAFEPTMSCLQVLKSKFTTNKHISICNKAVSNTEGTQFIYFDKAQSGMASLHRRDLKALDIELNLSEKIETIRLDNYIETNKIEHIHLLKIDIEGHEIAAFEGLGKYLNADFIDFIQFEYGGANLDSHTTLADFYRLLTPQGFKIAKIMRKGLQLRPYHPVMDNFCYSNYVAVAK